MKLGIVAISSIALVVTATNTGNAQPGYAHKRLTQQPATLKKTPTEDPDRFDLICDLSSASESVPKKVQLSVDVRQSQWCTQPTCGVDFTNLTPINTNKGDQLYLLADEYRVTSSGKRMTEDEILKDKQEEELNERRLMSYKWDSLSFAEIIVIDRQQGTMEHVSALRRNGVIFGKEDVWKGQCKKIPFHSPFSRAF